MITELEKYWPNLIGDNISFWKNQWDTHVTYSEDSFDEFGYFSLALKFKKNVDIFSYLDDAGIKPLPKVLYRSSKISEIGFFFFLVEMLLGVLGCVNFIMSLSENLVWHVLIGWCKPKGLHPVLIEFNLYIITSTKYLKQDLPN